MVPRVSPPEPSPSTANPRAWLVATALLPASLAAGQLDLSADGARDAGVVRTVGLGYAGSFRALDAWIAALSAGLPLGTRTLRAEIPGLLLVGAVAALLFVVVRRSLVAVAGSSAWASVVAALATATVSCSYPFQHEASSVATGLTGVALVLLALVVPIATRAVSPSLAGLSVLALTYEPAVGACVVLAVAARLLLLPTELAEPASPPPEPTFVRRFASGLAGVAGVAPFALATIRARRGPLSTGAGLFALPQASRFFSAAAGVRHAIGLLQVELGELLLVVAAVGFLWGLASRSGRRQNLPLALVTAAACGVLALGGGGGREAWSPVGLVALAGVVAFAGIAMHEAVWRVARARLPLASASAAMVVVLEAAFPAVLLDEGLAHAAGRPSLALSAWEDAAFGGVPGGTLLLVSAPRLYSRLLATEATGALPDDLLLLPTFDPSSEASASALARDPRLVPLFRDIALTGVPQELSLSTLAVARPLALATDPRWERTLTRHLVPGGLLAIFEPEPRGGADRKRALDASAGARARLAKALGPSGEGPLAALTASLLLDRALAAVQTGEREVALQTLADASAFAPKDTRIQRLMFKQTNARGAIDVEDLVRAGLAGEAP